MTYRWELKVREDKKVAQLRVELEGESSVEIGLGPNDVERFAKAVALARSQMIPPVPDKPIHPIDQRIENARVQIMIDGSSGLPAIVVRHPGFGWLTITISQEDAAALTSDLRQKTEWAAHGSEARN